MYKFAEKGVRAWVKGIEPVALPSPTPCLRSSNELITIQDRCLSSTAFVNKLKYDVL